MRARTFRRAFEGGHRGADEAGDPHGLNTSDVWRRDTNARGRRGDAIDLDSVETALSHPPAAVPARSATVGLQVSLGRRRPGRYRRGGEKGRHLATAASEATADPLVYGDVGWLVQ